MIGGFVGICEGAFVLCHQPHARLVEHGVGPAIMLLAPLVDALAYGFFGGLLGSVVAASHGKHPNRTLRFIAFGFAIASAHLTYLAAHAWVHISNPPQLADAVVALLSGLAVAIVVLRFGLKMWARLLSVSERLWPPSRAFIRLGALSLGSLSACLTALVVMMRAPEARSLLPLIPAGNERPNIVMIALDTARADHFSAYGYSKPTTPNLDDLARRGVLFETAVAPASWTLLSFASVLTGTLPNQNGTGRERPLPMGFETLASVLKARGYQSGGFHANWYYGTARTGLAQGFDAYDDDDGTLLTDLECLSFVKAFSWFLYYPLIRADYFPRRDARTLNAAIFHWFRRRSSQPYFLLVNYMDAHEPYSAVPDVGDRFGDAQSTLAYRIRAVKDGIVWWGIEIPKTPAEQATLIASYDSRLAYADSQIGKLLHALESSPDWSNTYVFVFGDHGQAIGEHQHYGHGWGLNWELLHVPLIVVGPGIPQGWRVQSVVGLQQIFATVLDLSADKNSTPARGNLRCYWTQSPDSCDPSPMVISELGIMPRWGRYSPSISVVTQWWHFIRDAADDVQLYDRTSDPGELVNLAASPNHQAELTDLQDRLFDRIESSALPWLGEDYLWALGERQFSLLAARHLVHSWPSGGFKRPPANQPQRPENELLHSLPYQ